MAHPGDSVREALAEVAAVGQSRDKKAGAKLLRLLGILTLIHGYRTAISKPCAKAESRFTATTVTGWRGFLFAACPTDIPRGWP